MKYVVKCPYCEHSYIVDAKEEQQDFQCDSCGGQNSIDDVVERINEPIIVEKEVVKTVVVREKAVKKEEEPDLEAIRSFDISDYPLEDNGGISSIWEPQEENTWPPGVTAILFIVLIIYVLYTFNKPEEETEQERWKREVWGRVQETESFSFIEDIV